MTGGQEADGQEYCKQAVLHGNGDCNHGILCPLPSEVGFTYGGYFCYQTVSLLAWLGNDYEPTLSGEYPDQHGDGAWHDRARIVITPAHSMLKPAVHPNNRTTVLMHEFASKKNSTMADRCSSVALLL